ncbi:MAG TPA: GntR family transcriptional regulator [Planctomycetota bacterium]|nr:GntR family transcriptional regulator [Planctomycetota bacterium]
MISVDKDSKQPLYLQVKDRIREQISSGELKAGSAIPDERTFAAELGLSRMTVRRAIVELTDEGLFERIPGRGTFVKRVGDPTALMNAPIKIGSIGVVAHFDAAEVRGSMFYYRILQGMMQNAHPSDALVFRKITTPPNAFVESLRQDTSLNALVVLGVLEPYILNAAAELNVPTVLVDSAQPTIKRLDSVSHAAEESCFQAVSHLLQQGHQEIGLMTFADTPAARERQAGFERALASRRLSRKPEFTYVVEASSQAAYVAGRRLLKAPKVPTAVFCTMDELALGLIAAAKDESWKVPQQLSVIGFGDLGQFCMPALSTIRIPVEQMGVTASQFLRERRMQPQLAPRVANLRTEFIARASSDVPRESGSEGGRA